MSKKHNTVEQIRRAKALYCRFVDTRQWTQFSELLEPKVQIRVFDPAGDIVSSFDDRDTYLGRVLEFLHGSQTIHQVHNDEIDLVSDAEVSGIWSMEDLIIWPKPNSGQPARLHGYGHYHDLWRLGPQGWRIARLELRRTILEITAP